MGAVYYSTAAIPHISLPDEDEQKVSMPLSMYKELMRVYKLYINQTERIYPLKEKTYPFNPDPVAPDYTRPPSNDWPQKNTVWC